MSKIFTFSLNNVKNEQVAFQQPVEVTSFSFDKDKVQQFDDRQLRFYHPPSLPADLSEGYRDSYIQSDPTTAGLLGPLLESVQNWIESCGSALPQIDFVTWRGLFTKLMYTNNAPGDSWAMKATRFQNTIYIVEDKRVEEQRYDGRSDLMSYWGYKFEELATLSKPWSDCDRPEIEQRNHSVVNTNEQYCSVVRTKIGPYRCILGGEVDCVWDEKPEPPENPSSHYVELKTSKVIRNAWDAENFEKRKLSKYWAQSFLLGVSRIIVGFRNNNGILQSIQEFNTIELPRIVKINRERPAWNAGSMISLLGALLHFIQKSMPLEDELWSIKHEANSSTIVMVKENDNGHSILSPSFVERMTK